MTHVVSRLFNVRCLHTNRATLPSQGLLEPTHGSFIEDVEPTAQPAQSERRDVEVVIWRHVHGLHERDLCVEQTTRSQHTEDLVNVRLRPDHVLNHCLAEPERTIAERQMHPIANDLRLKEWTHIEADDTGRLSSA